MMRKKDFLIMPIRSSSFSFDPAGTQEYTGNQNLIYQCETEIRVALPGIQTFEDWAGIVDHVWEKVRHRAENGPTTCRGRIKYVPMDDDEKGRPRSKKTLLSMSEIPAWIEKANPEWNPKWSALWAEPNIIVAGLKPLHTIWAVHEVAHQLVYYKHGWELNEEDTGHGSIWKQTYLDLLGEFYPVHAKLLEKTFVRNGVDI
jgi:hypothetical protein